MAVANPHVRTFPIPCDRGHDVVYGLARGPGEQVYLAPSNEFAPGLCAAVYAFDPASERFREVIDIRQATGFDAAQGLMPHSKVHLCLQSTRDGRAFAATHFTAPAIGQTSFDAMAAFRGGYPGTFLLEYNPTNDRVVNHGVLAPGEGARIACLDERHGQYYFLSYPRNHLFRYDFERRQLHDLGRMGQENSFGLEVDASGDVYTSDDLGRFWRYSFRRDRLEPLDLYVPLAPGRSPKGNYVRRMVLGADGCFYGCGNKGVRFFRLDPKRRALDDLGTVLGGEGQGPEGYPQLPPAKALAAQPDGTLLLAFGGDGIYPGSDQVPQLVRWDPVSRKTTDLGPFACGKDGLPAWIPQCAVATGTGGRVYFGLQQTVGQLRLWCYDPVAAPGVAVATDAWDGHRAAVARQPFGASVEGSTPLPFIRNGRAHAYELGWLGEDRAIPVGESAIGALAFGSRESLYGVTVGPRCHLFSFRTGQQNRFTENYEVHPWDLGVIGDGAAMDARIAVDRERKRLLLAIRRSDAVEFWSYAIGAELSAYRGVYHSVPHRPPVAWTAPPWDCDGRVPVDAIRFESLTFHPADACWFALDGSGRLVAARGSAGLTGLAGGTDLPAFAQLCAAEGRGLWAVTAAGAVARIEAPLAGRPAVQAAGTFSETVSVVAASSAGQLALGGVHGALAIVGWNDDRPTTLPPLRRRAPVTALAWHQEDSLWGFAGGEHDIGDAFCFRRGKLEKLGILQVPSQPRYWMAHRCRAVAVGSDGDAFFGEFDRIAHLFRVTA